MTTKEKEIRNILENMIDGINAMTDALEGNTGIYRKENIDYAVKLIMKLIKSRKGK